MTLNLSNKQIDDFWNSFSSLHQSYQKKFDYFEGKHKFLEKTFTLDGTKKSDVVINFLPSMVKANLSVATTNPYQYTPKDENDSDTKTALENLSKLSDENDLDTVDMEHFKNCLISGISVELIGFDAGNITIKETDPRTWAFIYDANGKVVTAINRINLQKNTFYNGTLLQKEHILTTVYDEMQTRQYLTTTDKKTIVFDTITANPFGIIPVVQFFINKDKSPLLSCDILKQNDCYNKTYNERLDSIAYDIDSMLLLTGFDPNAEDLHSEVKKAMKNKVIALKDSSSNAQFLSNPADHVKFDAALNDQERLLKQSAMMPDLQNIQSLGVQSGFALTIQFLGMKMQHGVFQRYIEIGLRDRIDVLNSMWKVTNQPPLKNYTITMNPYLPTDDAAVRSSLKEMMDVYSLQTLLELSPDIKDPMKELERIKAQRNAAPSTTPAAPTVQDNLTPEQKLERKNKLLDSATGKSAALSAQMKNNVQGLLDSDKFKKIVGA